MKKFFSKKFLVLSLFSVCLSVAPFRLFARSIDGGSSASPPDPHGGDHSDSDHHDGKDKKKKDDKSKIEKHKKHALKEINDVKHLSGKLSKGQKKKIASYEKKIKKSKKRKEIDNWKKKAIRAIESSGGGKQKIALEVARKENDEKLVEMSRMPAGMNNIPTKMLIQSFNNDNKTVKNIAAMNKLTPKINELYQQMTTHHGGGGWHPHGGGGGQHTHGGEPTKHRSEFRRVNTVSNPSQLINLIGSKKPRFVFMYSYIAGDDLVPTDNAIKPQQFLDLCERAWILVVKFDCSNSAFAQLMQHLGHPYVKGKIPEDYPIFSMFPITDGVKISSVNDIPAIKVVATRNNTGEVARGHTQQTVFTTSVMTTTQSYLNQANWHDTGLNPSWKDKAKQDINHMKEKIQDFIHNRAPKFINNYFHKHPGAEDKIINMLNTGIDAAIISNPELAPLKPFAKKVEREFNKWLNKHK
jgi:hypothetical protein